MMEFKVFIACLVFMIWIQIMLASGESHHCSRIKSRSQSRRAVRYYGCGSWWRRKRCAEYYRSYSTVYMRETYCCDGYTGDNCDTPVCNPKCLNSGLCLSPNYCACPSRQAGGRCELRKCSSSTDCYPGVCGGQAVCVCSSGFTGTNCQQMKDGPVFRKCQGRLINKDGTTSTILSSGNCSKIAESDNYVYTNQQSFSHVGFDAESTYRKLDVPDYPPGGFVRDYRVGVIQIFGTYILRSPDRVSLRWGTIRCSSLASKSNPFETLKCDAASSFPVGVANKQMLQIKVTSSTGGFKEIRRDDSAHIYDTRYFNGKSNSLDTVFFFDLKPPIHCTQNGKCPDPWPPLDIYPAITKLPNVSADFFGWDDDESHISKNIIKVYGTFLGSDGYLHETSSPLSTYTYTNTDEKSTRNNITLPSPGVYSFNGEVYDVAGNVALVRSTVLFGDTSIEMTDRQINVSDATRDDDTFWVRSTSGVIISWTGCFENRFLHENGLLAEMNPDFAGIQQNFGNRTAGKLDAILGISNFYYNLAHAIELPDIINADWERVDPLAQSVSMPLTSLTTMNGNTFHIKAEDIFQNTLTKRVYLRLDDSKPVVRGDPLLELNVTNSESGFWSSVDVPVVDQESGILKIEFRLLDVALGDVVIVEESQAGQKRSTQSGRAKRSVCSLPTDNCYCTLESAVEECYNTVQRVYINNCWLVRYVGEPVNFQATVYNRAQMFTEVEHNLGQIPELEGIEYYPGIIRLHVEQAFGYGVSIQWTLPPACYTIASIQVAVSGGKSQTLTLPADAVDVQINDLVPVRDYSVTVTVRYTNLQDSEPTEMMFNTGEAPDFDPNKLSVGAIIGIAIGCAIVIGLVVIGILIGLRLRAKKTALPQRLETVRNNLSNRLSQMFSRNNSTQLTDNVMYFAGEEDEVYYGDNKNTGWKLHSSKLQIGDVIAQGKFAVIYHGVLQAKNGPQEVAVKMVQEPTETNKLLLQSKMNFLATNVKPHPNLVNFMGGVEEGPMLLLELCDQPLKRWLRSTPDVDATVLDQMYLFSAHVARALHHLHTNKIIHRRLGLRNVLIKTEYKRLIAKVTGYGPMKKPKDEAILPLKWMAPEQLGLGQGKPRSYDTKTDVWSYAVTVWEIFNKGDTPYPNIRSSDLKDQLDEGMRLECPDNCSDELYEKVMMPCWNKDPDSRPEMHVLVKHIDSFVTGADDQEYYADDEGSSQPRYGNI